MEPQISVPKPVIDFFSNFQRSINEKKVAEIQHAYDELPAIISAFFTNQLLPPVEILGKHLEIIGIFELLYDQLRYRLIFARREATYEEFHESFFMHHKLFGFILKDELSRQIFLPKQWIWDILDSFVFQFTQHMIYEACKENAEASANQKPIWKPVFVLQTLTELVQAAKFYKMPYHQMIKLFGVFSAVQLLRLNTVFGDFYFALKAIEDMDSEQEAMMVYDCKATYYYYAAFAAMMSREYQRSIRYCVLLLNGLRKDINPSIDFTLQTKNFENKVKYILAISFVLYPCRLDENTGNQLREYAGELIANMNKGNLDSFVACFNEVYQDFLQLTPDYKQSNIRAVFIEEMTQCLCIPPMRGMLKLYSTLPLAKLASATNMLHNNNANNKSEDDIKTTLLLLKQKTREIKIACSSCTDDLADAPLPSTANQYFQVQPLPDYDFSLDSAGIIHTFDTKIERKLGDFLVKQILRFDEINKNLKKIKTFA